MKKLSLFSFTFAAGLFACAAVYAAPPHAPAGSTAQCRDGSYYFGAAKNGACRGHKGVRVWYGLPPVAHPVHPVHAAPVVVRHPPVKVVPAAHPAVVRQVWVNAGTRVYHCPGDKWYGKTKHGVYMSEASARAKGFHPDHGAGCR